VPSSISSILTRGRRRELQLWMVAGQASKPRSHISRGWGMVRCSEPLTFHSPQTMTDPHTMGGLTLSLLDIHKRGKVSSNSVTHKGTQFAGPQEISYAPVHNSNLLTGARRSVLNQLRWGLPHWSYEFMIQTTLNLPIHYSPLSPRGFVDQDHLEQFSAKR
jgi:hypothetical protein